LAFIGGQLPGLALALLGELGGGEAAGGERIL
jgi:hypothetical protein